MIFGREKSFERNEEAEYARFLPRKVSLRENKNAREWNFNCKIKSIQHNNNSNNNNKINSIFLDEFRARVRETSAKVAVRNLNKREK